MTVKMDSAGRIVLPKPVREHLALSPGAELDLEEENGKLTLTPTARTSGLVRKDGYWVMTGKLPPGFDFQKFIDEMREERFREIMGL